VVVDASEGLTDLDLQVAYEAQRAKCATAILFNKWDIATIDLDKAVERIKARVQMKPPHLKRLGADKAWGRSDSAVGARPIRKNTSAASRHRNSTGGWGRFQGQHPSSTKGRQGDQGFYMVQYEQAPPRFKVMVNARALVNKPYAYYLENHLRDDYELEGVPLIIDFEVRKRGIRDRRLCSHRCRPGATRLSHGLAVSQRLAR